MSFRFIIRIIGLFVLPALWAGSVFSATLIVDQTGSTLVSGGYTGTVVQSFTPAQNNIAGLDPITMHSVEQRTLALIFGISAHGRAALLPVPHCILRS